MNVTATLNNQSVTIVDISSTGSNCVMVSYIDPTSILKTTMFGYDPKISNTLTIATSATAI